MYYESYLFSVGHGTLVNLTNLLVQILSAKQVPQIDSMKQVPQIDSTNNNQTHLVLKAAIKESGILGVHIVEDENPLTYFANDLLYNLDHKDVFYFLQSLVHVSESPLYNIFLRSPNVQDIQHFIKLDKFNLMEFEFVDHQTKRKRKCVYDICLKRARLSDAIDTVGHKEFDLQLAFAESSTSNIIPDSLPSAAHEPSASSESSKSNIISDSVSSVDRESLASSETSTSNIIPDSLPCAAFDPVAPSESSQDMEDPDYRQESNYTQHQRTYKSFQLKLKNAQDNCPHKDCTNYDMIAIIPGNADWTQNAYMYVHADYMVTIIAGSWIAITGPSQEFLDVLNNPEYFELRDENYYVVKNVILPTLIFAVQLICGEKSMVQIYSDSHRQSHARVMVRRLTDGLRLLNIQSRKFMAPLSLDY